jgi:hypothetical protein
MRKNSEKLSEHLRSILCLKQMDQSSSNDIDDDSLTDDDGPALDSDILHHVIQLDLPLFISIDVSLDNGTAISSINIVIPDIRQHDIDMEWQHRTAKTLLTRSWKLPKAWGVDPVCINMAEVFGLIIGEYSIPPDMPTSHATVGLRRYSAGHTYK